MFNKTACLGMIDILLFYPCIVYYGIVMLEVLKNIWSPKMVIFPIFSLLTTFVCVECGFTMDMKVVASVFFIGIFVTFSIVMNTADERRFKAYEEVAYIKANLLNILQLSKYRQLGKQSKQEIANALSDVIPAISDFLYEKSSQKAQEKLVLVDKTLLKIETVVEMMRKVDFPPPELTRIHQLLGQIYFSFEKLITIKEQRSPLSLRLFLKYTLGLSVFVLAPEFANLGYWGVFVSTVIAFILITLIEIQGKIENPFDERSNDDVNFNFLPRFTKRINHILD